MAELISAETNPRLREQAAAIAVARWRLLVNSVRTTRGALELVSRIWAGFGFSMLGLGGAAAFGFGTGYFLAHGEPNRLAWLLWLLTAFWQIFPLATAAFAEHVDVTALHRFPLSYPAYVAVRITFGSFDAATLVGVLCLVGFVAGVGAVAAAWLPLALAAAAGFAVFNIVLAQMIFAWLERWLARRRTREILALLFFLGLFSLNLLGPLLARLQHVRRPELGGAGFAGLGAVLAWLPPALPGTALALAGQGRWLAAPGALLLLFAWAGAALALLHLRLRAEYRGEAILESGPAAKPRRGAARPAAAARPLGWDLGAPGAIAGKELRYLFRSPMALFSLVIPVLLVVFFRFGMVNPTHRAGHALALAGAGLGFPIGAAYALLVLTNLVFNLFGTDAAGVQFYFAAPVRFREVLLGKNLAYGTLVVLELAVIYAVAWMIDGLAPAWVQGATFAGIAFAVLFDFTCGNLISLYLPKKIDLSRLGRQSARGASGLIALGVQLVALLLAGIAVLGAVVLHRLWLATAILAVLAGLAGLLYHLMLEPCERLALARREVLISELSK